MAESIYRGAGDGVFHGPNRAVVLGRVGAVATAATLVGAIAVTVVAGAWGGTLRQESRLLPGTSIAGVDVGGATQDEAREQAAAAVAVSLDAPVTLTHRELSWSITPRELGATTDLDERIAAAGRSTDDATLPRLVRLRWGGADPRPLQVGIELPREPIATFVGDIADELDQAPTDATLRWQDGAPTTTAALDGLRVDRDATIAKLRTALDEVPAHAADPARGANDVFEVITETMPPEVSTRTVTEAHHAVLTAIEAALDHTVTARHGETTWTVTPRALEAEPLGDDVVAAALTDTPTPVELAFPDGPLEALLTDMAGSLDIAPVHAGVSYTGGTIRTSPGRDGRALDREGAREALLEALRGDGEVVDLELGPARARTRGDVGDVLLVRQGERVVELHRDGQVVRSWPVAVGTGGSPTPTGTFTVGAKRFEPTWVNPALDRWGKDLPARIGPGPDNPLGLRALNWNRPGGGDTLIRFHGTPNEASIGTASSNGCVRMFNADVIELYDLVPSGATILSVA